MSETINSIEQPTALKEVWSASRASRLQVYEQLNGNGDYREQQEQQFIAGEIVNPILDAPNLNQVDIDNYLNELWELYASVETHTNESSLERAAYNGIIANKLAQVYYLHQARNLLDMGDLPEKDRASQYLEQQAEELYGLPEPAIFNSMINNLREKVVNYQGTDDISSTIKQELLNLLPENLSSTENQSVNYAELINHYRPLVETYFTGLLAVVPDDKDKFEPEDMMQIFSAGIRYYESVGFVEPGKWDSIIDPDSKSVSTSQERCRVEVGAKRKAMSNIEMKQALLHEVGVHVQRRLLGDKANFAALGTGLVGYEDPEEGIGVVLEQIYDGQPREAGVQYYTLLGLAIGLDGKKRDFRQTYEIAWRREAMLKLVDDNQELNEKTLTKVKKQAYTQCVRIFRGTPCNLPGVVFPKDIFYFDGNEKIWRYLNAIKNDDTAFGKLFLGKYNPTDPDHQKLLEAAEWT
ncbi:MAG: tyrosine/phenylalanine carboxypeptidase domain-containing protein [Candidatus Saccharimonadales bacterium]